MSTVTHKQVAVRVIPTCFAAAIAISINTKQSFVGSQDKAAEIFKVEPIVAEEPKHIEEQEEVEDYIWLARCIFSESKRPSEQELVAWVVRNRFETKYRGKKSYKDVILDPFQFSAFNPTFRKYDFYVKLDQASNLAGWRTAQKIAKRVLDADPNNRPFPINTRHFYSEISMIKGLQPAWTVDREPLPMEDREIEEERFRFYAGVI